MIYCDRVQNASPIQVHFPIGSHSSIITTASGKLYFSSLSKTRCQKIIRKMPLQGYARNTITQAGVFQANIQKVQRAGIATDNKEFIDGVVAIGTPIQNTQSKLFAVLFTHAPMMRLSFEQLLELTPFRTAGS